MGGLLNDKYQPSLLLYQGKMVYSDNLVHGVGLSDNSAVSDALSAKIKYVRLVYS